MRRRLLGWCSHAGVLIGLLAALASLHAVSTFVTDDAAITLRYAKHLADGEGIRWNPGEHPVEGYSNFSHVVLGAAAIELGLPPLSSLRLFNQASLLLLCLLIYALTLQVLGSRLWAAAAALLVGAHPSFAYWASSGLETASYCVACYAGIYASQRVASRWAFSPALALLVAALTRFEGPVVFAAVLVPLVLRACKERRLSSLRVHLVWITLFVLGYLAYFLFRYRYFGHLLSNSAYYKVRDVNSGFSLIQQFVAQNAALIALAAFADWRRLGASGAIAASLSAVYAAGFYGVKDSVADFHRFLSCRSCRRWSYSRCPRCAGFGPHRTQGSAVACWQGRCSCSRSGSTCFHPVSGLANVSAEVRVLDTRIESRAAVASTLAEHFLEPTHHRGGRCGRNRLRARESDSRYLRP